MLLLVALLNSAAAYEVLSTDDGDPLRWHAMPVGYSWIDEGAPDLAHLDRAVEGAFEAWARVPHADIDVSDDHLSGVPEVALDDVDGVFFDPDWPMADDGLALAATWVDADGRVVAFDIHVNPRVPWATDQRSGHYDLQAALTHEVGHVLGLDHSALEDATMYATQGPQEDFRRVLSDDDRDGAVLLYGQGLAEQDAALPPVVACSTGPGSTGSLAVWIPLLALTFAGRARAGTHAEVPDLASLASTSTSVVRGVVVERETVRGWPGLHTRYTVQVEETLRGDAESHLVVTLPGGQLDGLTQHVAGVPSWLPGDEVVVFVPEDGVPRRTGVLTVREGRIDDPLRRAVPEHVEALEEVVLTAR